MNKIRVALFFTDVAAAKSQLAEAKKLAADGGDWDRNNRLSVYESAYAPACKLNSTPPPRCLLFVRIGERAGVPEHLLETLAKFRADATPRS